MSTRLLTLLFAFAVVGHYAPARADTYGKGPVTFDAMCEVRKEGDTRQGASGPCGFSHRQGYVTLDLRNGDVYNLTPGNEAGRFKDQKGQTVVRTQSGNGFQEFKWEGGKHIIVTFPERYRQPQYGWQPPYGQPTYGQPYGQPVAYRIGETPEGLASLIGTKADENDLKRLGYNWVQGSDNGPGRHALWFNSTNHHCVRVRVENNHYQSITETDPRECRGQQDAYRIGETPPGLASLIGTQADENDLKRLGYNWVQGSDNGPGRHALWFNPTNRHCVRVRVENNHYQSITGTDPKECTGQQGAYRVGETPQGLASLIGTKADENDLKRLGYNWVNGSPKGAGRHALWYNPQNRYCVRVHIEGDRYQTITTTNPNECTS